ncbi:glucose-6-phosphate dehydrogenase [Lapillicoccus jejuensis]|uniref:Glucose-6-phosphate 1-dehydrogenase n=1 Tax=Lapillicoccus jejuensis TaxID=402171 RepID=A0A542E633_9MICO|nr:glucose-6-phosphate dehydrogenase [Lapillicoccus jejuensis]TQJ10764.1 glucose-6-phosphate 1-dehydrogenase [Lapillicoccus jejuensis]
MSDALVFVLFGATGDLAKRMVIPAFHELHTRGLMPDRWRLVGNGRGDVSHEDFHQHVKEVLTEFGGGDPSGPEWDDFTTHLRFAGGGFEKSDPGSLLDVLHEAEADLGEARYVHYLAIPPSAFRKVTEGLAEHDLVEGSRVVYEKPFGTSPESFHELDELVHSTMDEEQVYRIDHFLGKEATQNLHVLRFGNQLVGRSWCADAVEQVQIDVPEKLDVADRAEFYDATGAFKDMIVTHLFQVAAEVAMEPPASMRAEDLQDARESVLAAFRPLDPEELVLGQYEGYRDLDDVPDDSRTDTFAAVRLWVDTDRWRGVPFVLRSGKMLGTDAQVVSLVMRKPEGPLTHIPGQGVLQFSLKGSGAIEARFVVKEPGPDLSLTRTRTVLDLGQVAEGAALPPYVALLHDVVEGDRSLFTSSAGLDAAWGAVARVLEQMPDPTPYAPGSTGPAAARALTGDVGWLADEG